MTAALVLAALVALPPRDTIVVGTLRHVLRMSYSPVSCVLTGRICG
jgi:hypothetical protein